jgi:hypothetical protein
VPHFVVVEPLRASVRAASGLAVPPKSLAFVGAEWLRKLFVETMHTYPGTYQEEGVCKFVGKIEFVINRSR